MSGTLHLPEALAADFRQFARDFAAVGRQWVAMGEETPESVEAARAGLRAYLEDPADPDGFGVARADRIQQVFRFWRALAVRTLRTAPRPAGVVPVLIDVAEARLADVWWERRNG